METLIYSPSLGLAAATAATVAHTLDCGCPRVESEGSFQGLFSLCPDVSQAEIQDLMLP